MIAKKNPKADLEKKRFAFFQIGLIVAGSLCLAAFEYTTVTTADVNYKVDKDFGQNTLGPDILPEPMEPQKQEQKKSVVIVDKINVVKNKPDDSKVIIPDDKKDKGIIVIDEGLGGDDEGFNYVEPSVPIIEVPDVDPQFPGGLAAMAEFINDEIELPDYIPEYDEGTIFVEFVVNRNGSIEQVKTKQGTSKELNKVAEKVVQKMPRWIPGEQAGKPVRVRFILPIKIQLN